LIICLIAKVIFIFLAPITLPTKVKAPANRFGRKLLITSSRRVHKSSVGGKDESCLGLLEVVGFLLVHDLTN
jgi:hypothetical protein